MDLCTSKLLVPVETTEVCSTKQRGNKLIANPGIFHTLFYAFHKCCDKVHYFKREYAQVAGGRTMKSTPQKAVCEQMAWVVLAAYPKATDTSHVIYFHMNLARIGLATPSRNQFSQETKIQAFTLLSLLNWKSRLELLILMFTRSNFFNNMNMPTARQNKGSSEPRILSVPGARRGCEGRISEQGDHTVLHSKYFHYFQIKISFYIDRNPQWISLPWTSLASS